MEMSKRPFIIDCDTGTDDAIAIMAALNCPQVEIRAITSVNGNVAEVYTSVNNLNLVEYLGRRVPVAHGAVRPLLSGFINNGMTDSTHGRTGMGTIVLPEAKASTFDPRVASELIYDVARECGGELELLVIGPMTNIAITLCNHRDLSGLIKHLWFMGGAVTGGNVSPTAEFNVWADPEAAHIVLESGVPATMVGLDVTLKAVMVESDAQALRKVNSRDARLTAELLEFMFVRRDRGGEDAVMHDALAFAAAVCPGLLTFEDRYVDVVTGGGYAYGHTFVDRPGDRSRTGRTPNVSVALGIDPVAFRRWLVETISGGAKN